ncbi:MAG: hypothetical protein GC179_28350 [Anaerolineaceae bacterium]|nr:hypothetical protein [Anaerolineaceae bacterium]
MDFILSHLHMEKLVKADEKKIRKALEDSKKQSATWSKYITRPTVSGDGLIDLIEVQPYLKQCLGAVENGLVEMAQRFSPVQWLWYLRRFPSIHSIEDEGFENYCLTLAIILSTRSHRKDDSEQFDTQLSFPLTQSIANHVLAFVAGCYDLGDLHIKYGAAGREIPFRISSKRLPDAVLTESKREAGRIFDARQNIGISGLAGTIPSQSDLSEKSPLLVVDKVYYPVAIQLPYFEFRGLETPPFVPTYYLPTQVPLKHISNLYKLTDNGNKQWVRRDGFSLMLLAGLLLPISATAPEHSINIAMYGYSVHERVDFVVDYWPAFDELVSVIKNLFPSAELPATPIQLLDEMERLETSTHPLLPGVVMGDKKRIVIDHASVKDRFGMMLRFPNLGGGTGNQRGIHFEDAIQSYIDASVWKSSDELRAMRQVHLIRRGHGKNNQITDIDAIGESGDTLLIISCKAVIFSVGQDIGEYHALKNARLRLDEAVIKWQAVKAELLDSPIGQNYNFRRYSKIIAVVCTPNAVYTESALSLSYEVGNLRKAATAPEFIEWLNT